MIDWGAGDVAKTLGIPKEKVRLVSPFIGGGFGGKLFVRADAILSALGARAAGRPVKVALQRPLIFNNTTHRPATIQRIRIGAGSDGKISAIGHESWSGNLAGGSPETAVLQTRLLYAGANRMTAMRLARLDLPEGNAMRAPGEAPGMMALEIAMDEMAERLGLDPLEFRKRNDTQVDPNIRSAVTRNGSLSNACASAPNDSAGTTAILNPAKSVTGAGWWDSAWRRRSATIC
jgi:xanthine dehydrogenase YagR molybdenum-binding subunit